MKSEQTEKRSVGKPSLYNEKTATLSKKVPISHKKRLMDMLNEECRKLQKPINNLKKIKGR